MQCGADANADADADADADTSLSSFPLDWTAWYGARLEGWMSRIPRAEGGAESWRFTRALEL